MFRRYDQDNDGFISYKDFESTLLKKKINASKDDIAGLMKNVLDKDGDGYIDFKSFQKVFGPNMSKSITCNDREVHLPNI